LFDRQDVSTDEEDYRLFLKSLARASARHDCTVHAYVLMSKHVHLLVTPRGDRRSTAFRNR
jgi:putative transposase